MSNHEQVRHAFEDGSVFAADDQTLDSYLKTLGSGPVAHAMDVMAIRCSIINTIKTDRYIKKVNRRNAFLTGIIIFLAVVTIGVAFWSEWRARETAQQVQELVELQKKEVQLLIETRK